MLQSLFNLTTALHVSGVTITNLQEHKTTVLTERFGLVWFGSRSLLDCKRVIIDKVKFECLGKVLMDSTIRKLRI